MFVHRCKLERDRQTDTDRQTDRQIDRKTHRQTKKQTETERTRTRKLYFTRIVDTETEDRTYNLVTNYQAGLSMDLHNLVIYIYVRDREPRTATSTFTQLLSSVIVQFKLLYVHRDHKDR